jgi:hypothetical protein
VAALVVGGVLAAPIGAHLTRRLPLRVLVLTVGALVVGLSVRSLYVALAA